MQDLANNTGISNQIKSRRSVYPKQLSGEEIPQNNINEALEAANWAPTHKKTQPWRFHVYSGEAKNDLVDFWIRQAMESCFSKGENWDDTKQQKFDLFKKNASHIIAIACYYTGLVPEIEETCATAAAVQNFWLALSSMGYGGYWSTGNGVFSNENHQFHALSSNEKLLGYFVAGVPVEPIAPSTRKPLEQVVTWH